jgi:protein-L-isoaspartate(D-aspartate) O-methyltransferase
VTGGCKQPGYQEQERPTSEDEEAGAGQLRHQMVENLCTTGGVLRDQTVREALEKVPRHRFLPGVPLEQAYADVAIPTHWQDQIAISSASQPAIVAIMLQQLRITPGANVLEIGAGTGYNAALLSELVGPEGHVTTLDIDPEIVAEAAEHLGVAGYTNVRAVTGDGAAGWPESAPYDRIILTVGASDIAPAWFQELQEEGVLVLPLWLGGLELSVAFRKQAGSLIGESQTPCGFMRLRGEESGAEQWVALPQGRKLLAERATEIAKPVALLLSTRPRLRLWFRPPPSFFQHLGLSGQRLVAIYSDRNSKVGQRIPVRWGLYAEDGDGPSLAIFAFSSPILLAFGGHAAEHIMARQHTLWQGLDTQPIEQWRITARPRAAEATGDVAPFAGTLQVERRHFIFTIEMGTATAHRH